MEVDDPVDNKKGAENEKSDLKKRVYIPGKSRNLKEGEFLDYDPDAYKVFHTFKTALPCLSFDIILDDLERYNEYPISCYLVSGTQADKAKDNELITMHISNINPEQDEKETDSDAGSDDEDCIESKPKFHSAFIPNYGNINRIKSKKIGSENIAAVWNDKHGVQLWNLAHSIDAVNSMKQPTELKRLKEERPLFTFSGHSVEGYSLSWSPLNTGDLVSGDIHSKIFLWKMTESGRWSVDQRPLNDHDGSIEDLQWSPTEAALLISCSSDRSLRLWDVRCTPKQSCVCSVQNAHESDVNVLHWNKYDSLILTGGDDAAINIWSLKTIQYKQPVARFKHHTKPITSVEWNPNETTTFMASSDDDQVTIWDLSLECDELDEKQNDNFPDIPPQLLFVHMGQNEIKEVHWHPQIPGLAITTALNGFNIFKTINC